MKNFRMPMNLMKSIVFVLFTTQNGINNQINNQINNPINSITNNSTINSITNNSTINSITNNSTINSITNNFTIKNIKNHKLCFSNVLKQYMKDLYNNFDFKYEDIVSSIGDMTMHHIPGQNFFITYQSIDKIFHNQEKAHLFLKITNHLKENVSKELAFVKETAPEKIKNFLRSYLIKLSKDLPDFVNPILDSNEKFDLYLNNMFTCKTCSSMFSQLYLISVLDRISKKLIDPIKFDGLSNSELKFILLKDMVLMSISLKNIKMNNEELMNEFNLMIEKRFKLFSDYSSVMFALHWVNYPYTWSRRMNRHFEYESRLSTLQRLFRARFEFPKWKNTNHLNSINLIIDTQIDTLNNTKNEIILKSIKSIEIRYFNNKTEFITVNNAEIIQNINNNQNLSTRISFKKTYDNQNYTLNMIFFDRESKINNDIFLYDIRSEYVLNIYKVFNTIVFDTDYDGKIERLIIWTLTDEYDSRLNINMINNITDIIEITTAVLKGLKDLETQSIFYPDMGFDDIVVCNTNSTRTYKIDLRRAFKLDQYEIRKFGLNEDYYHNDTIEKFSVFFKQMIDHSKLAAGFFDGFVNILNKQYKLGRILKYDDLLKRLP